MGIRDEDRELARRLGMDTYQAGEARNAFNEWENRIVICTFEAPPDPARGLDLPRAFLPPDYSTFGILDSAHRTKIREGEAWICEVRTQRPAIFLVPLARLTVDVMLQLRPEFIREVASHVAARHPAWAKELAEKLPGSGLAAYKARAAALEATVRELEEAMEDSAQHAADLEGRLADAKATPVGVEGEAARVEKPPPVRVHRPEPNVLESPAFTHPAYDAFYTPSGSAIVLQPAEKGLACSNGRIRVPGLEILDPQAGPREYETAWDAKLGGFLIHLREPPT